MANAINAYNNIKTVTRQGDWVIPVMTSDNKTIYALQINKTQADKDNLDTILSDYQKAGVEVLTYNGKNDLPVYLVDATQKLKAQRANVNRDAIIETLVSSGMTQELAQATYAKMQETVKAKKANK